MYVVHIYICATHTDYIYSCLSLVGMSCGASALGLDSEVSCKVKHAAPIALPNTNPPEMGQKLDVRMQPAVPLRTALYLVSQVKHDPCGDTPSPKVTPLNSKTNIYRGYTVDGSPRDHDEISLIVKEPVLTGD